MVRQPEGAPLLKALSEAETQLADVFNSTHGSGWWDIQLAVSHAFRLAVNHAFTNCCTHQATLNPDLVQIWMWLLRHN